MKYLLSSLIIILASGQLAHAQLRFSADERRVITITDERRDADSLIPYLTSSNVRLARRAAIGIGNIGDTTIRTILLEQFQNEHRDTVADAEAFALGLLGPNERVVSGLLQATGNHPTTERLKALARCATPGYGASLTKLVGYLTDQKKIDHLTAAKTYVELALHKQTTAKMWDDLENLANDPDANVRWRAAYAFARGDDSSDLAGRFPKLKDLLLDQGSAYVRMFGASALGKLHNSDAEAALNRAYRGEEEWRVRINILNALSHSTKLDSATLETLELATTSGTRNDPIGIHLGLSAQDVLEHFITSGTLTSADSNNLRSWLDGFNGTDGRNEEVDPMVSARAMVNAAHIGTPTLLFGIQNYAQYGIPVIRNYAVCAASVLNDTGYFTALLVSMPAVAPMEQLARLEALDSMWQRAKKDPAFRNQLETAHSADVYRYLLIHVSDADQDPAVVTTALSHLMDSTIIHDSATRADARQFLPKYIRTFSQQPTRDQLLASLVAESWLGDTAKTLIPILRIAYDSANTWGDLEVLDTITEMTHKLQGPTAVLPARIPRRSHIDWNTLESLPPKLIINLEQASIQLRLLTDEAPLTVLNMVKLAREQYFAGQTIHRVVPNFVIQSGDPTGTGWGGPGYTIRSELTPLEYSHEGVVGMARDGKDTEGSQWFITESPTPHLDAKYTVWAEVVNGMDEVLKRKVGDKIDTFIPFR